MTTLQPWNDTIAAAPEGLIVVSLGTQANSSAMTLVQAKALVGALSRFNKYRIYWRVGPSMSLPGVDLKSVSDHINLTAYLPQNDLLGKPAITAKHLQPTRRPSS